jgi:uncharacterized metal-binding protein
MILAFAISNGEWLLSALFFPVGYGLGWLVDPDLDMGARTEADKRWRNTIIFLPMVLWWKVYAGLIRKYFGGHRSMWGHLPLFSTSIRLAWMLIPVTLVGIWAGFRVSIAPTYVIQVTLGVLAGLSLSDLVHFLADMRVIR